MENMEHIESMEAKEALEKSQYIQGIVGELMGDQEWQLPPQLRFFLMADLEWTMLGL